jgi:hypothetical protein
MGDKSSVLRAFNTHFFEFLDDIAMVFPENSDIQSARRSFEALKKANPVIVVRVWLSAIYLPYTTSIDTGDISFFFDKDYSLDLINSTNQDAVLQVINKIRGPVRDMSSDNKINTMTYIQNLSKLSSLYHSLA